jgi:hypothetical protein
MNTYYARTFVGLAVVLGVLTVAAIVSNAFARDAKVHREQVLGEAQATTVRRAAQQQRTSRLNEAVHPIHVFAAAWKDCSALPERDAAERIRSEIEIIAQRQLGLVTDGAITPQPERSGHAGSAARVQRVTLRASGKDLAALLTWIGKVEERYPAAHVEMCEFTSNVGGNTGLTIRLVEPVSESSARRRPTNLPADTEQLLEMMTLVDWKRYLPAVLKSTQPIGFQRNPLQPAVAADTRTVRFREDGDELAPRLETALEGRVRSVIRGSASLVVIDGRVFRVGDELMVGKHREKPIPDVRTKLKQIGEDRLVLQISGGTSDHPVQCDVVYPLPAFLKAR